MYMYIYIVFVIRICLIYYKNRRSAPQKKSLRYIIYLKICKLEYFSIKAQENDIS